MNQTRRTTRAILVPADDERTLREPYDLVTAARLAGVHPERIRHYCRLGLLREAPDPDRDELYLTDQSVYELRRIEYLRQDQGVNLRGIRIILDLLHSTENLRETIRFYQSL